MIVTEVINTMNRKSACRFFILYALLWAYNNTYNSTLRTILRTTKMQFLNGNFEIGTPLNNLTTLCQVKY